MVSDKTIQKTESLSIVLCGQAGQGIQTVEFLLTRILKTAGYDRCFDFYEANQFKEEKGKAIGLELKVYKNKPQLLLKLLRERNLDEKRTVYLGDSDEDAGCFEIVGHPVISFLAPEELKERYAQKYKAFVPIDEEDLAKYLRDV